MPGHPLRPIQSAAPATTVPVEPPNRNPRIARRWHIRRVSVSGTMTTSSIIERSSAGGVMPMPSPGMRRDAAGPPKLTEPSTSIATILTSGRCCLNQRAVPISVPQVPAPTNTTLTWGNVRAIAGPVWA